MNFQESSGAISGDGDSANIPAQGGMNWENSHRFSRFFMAKHFVETKGAPVEASFKIVCINFASGAGEREKRICDSVETASEKTSALISISKEKVDFTAVKNFCEAKTTGKARLYTDKEQRQAVSRIEAFLIDRRFR